VADNGKGFNAAENKFKGNGLGNFQKRLKALYGTVAIQSGENGTEITFEMPLY
jgi:signal transduction histidine kinase